MSFTSVQYLAFLALVAIEFWVVPRRFRPAVLLVASYAFYGFQDWRFVPILAATTVVSWLLGRAIAASQGSRRRGLFIGALAIPLAVLFGFKLIAYGSETNVASGFAISFGAGSSVGAVPIGLAFYTFQVISYLVDIYRGELEPQPSIVVYASYVAFFPHLLAGPIVRARRLMPQLIDTPVRPDPVRVTEGIELVFFGLFKKVAVADPLLRLSATGLAGGTGAEVNAPSMVLLMYIGLIGGFFDIAGYIDIARGSAKILGIDMPPNFAQPLTRSRNWTEFWRRWQITIMAWFRDYVYLPVRGRGRAGRREIVALLCTFLAAGLWHGLSVGWIIWAALTAGLLLIEQRFKRYRAGVRRRTGGPRHILPAWLRAIIGPLYVFGAVVISSPFAATTSVSDAFAMYGRVISGGWGGPDLNLAVFSVWGLAALFLTDQYERRKSRTEGQRDPVTIRRAFAYGTMVLALVIFTGSTTQSFVYFQF